ncbi:MAG: sensor domain-containing diguanylate cyclase [Gammaproteobacteria bacterium]
MQKPVKPADETTRIDTLHALDILDTSHEERFDRLTRLAKRLFSVPIALVSLVDEDRQWFKSCQGLSASETSRDISFCGHAILGDDIFLITDATMDERFHDNPLVSDEPHIRFYAGYPLSAPNGSKLGTLCIIDSKPRELGEDDQALLRDLGRMAEQELAAVQLATIDELTTLSNRRGFEALSLHALGICRRLGRPASMLFFDLDLFKQINDRFGHAEGDHALTSFARILKQNFRESDLLGRLGGDEFAVLLTNTSKEELNDALQRLQHTLDQYNHTSRRGYDIVYSVGAVQFDATRHADVADLMAQADTLMYEQKKQRHGAVHTEQAPGTCEQAVI